MTMDWQQWVSNKVQTLKDKTDRYEKAIPYLSFMAGFLWDSLTLSRIDRLKDNLTLVGYWLGFSVGLVLLYLGKENYLSHPRLVRGQKYYPLLLNFCQGGLFSAYVVYYFQSASLSKNFIFVALLFLLWVANEFLTTPLEGLGLHIALYFLLTHSLTAFLFPILGQSMGHQMFVFSSVVSFLLVVLLLALFYRTGVIKNERGLLRLLSMVTGLFWLLETFYQTNLIPPVPLSLKSAGVYHQVKKVGGAYRLLKEKPQWYQVWRTSDSTFHFVKDQDQVVGFFSIFAPVGIKQKIDEVWLWEDPSLGDWRRMDHHRFTLIGGRAGGWRSYFRKRKIADGAWKVELTSEEGKLLGQLHFEIKTVDKPKGKMIWVSH